MLGSNTALGTGSLNAASGTSLDSSQAVTLGNNVNLAGPLTVLGSNDLTLGGTVAGAGRLLKAGAARFALMGANTYSGGTELQAGTLVVGNNAALGTGAWTSPAMPTSTAPAPSAWPTR